MDLVKYLINRQHLKVVRPQAEFDDSTINPFIFDAQQYDLRPFLGDAFYYDILKRFEDEADGKYQDYKKLLYGTVYTYRGVEIQYLGIQIMLAYFTLSRVATGLGVSYTRFGMVQKLEGQGLSQPLSDDEKYTESKILKSNAIAEQSACAVFLDNNRTTYPLWGAPTTVHTTQRSALNIGKI